MEREGCKEVTYESGTRIYAETRTNDHGTGLLVDRAITEVGD